MTVLPGTTISTLALAVQETLLDYEIDDIGGLFEAAGIDRRLLQQPLGRIPNGAMRRLWELCVGVTGDEAFGLQVGKHVTPSTFFALGIGALTSRNALEVAKIVVMFGSLVSTTVDIQLNCVEGQWCLKIGTKPGTPEYHPAGIDAGFAAIMHIAETYVGLNVRLDKVSFSRPMPDRPEVYEAWFGCAVDFDAPANALYSSHQADLDRPFPMANSALRSVHEKILVDYVNELSNQSIATRVRHELTKRLKSNVGVGRKAISRAMGMSERKLQNMLKGEGTHFQEVLDSVRESLAVHMLGVERRRVSDIALRLGFSEVSSFTRAFKRWTGKTPRRYFESYEDKHANDQRYDQTGT